MATDKKIIVTSGKKYLDIDAYASMIAERELLRALGHNAFAVSSAPMNQSVPPLVRNLRYQLDDDGSGGTEYILLDVSNPEFFDEIVDSESITEVVDHHTGFEQYWQERGVKNQIEFIGAVCTIIFERIIGDGKQGILDEDLCKMLMAGILDNTLNLRSDTTTERDLAAYAQLKSIGNIDDSWREEYFEACTALIMQDYKGAILADLKIEDVAPILPQVVGQMLLLDADRLNCQMVAEVLADYPEWVMNIISLKDGKSYLYFYGAGVKERLQRLFGQSATNEQLLILDHFLLRKQIMKRAREYRD